MTTLGVAIDTQLPDNTSELITPATLRQLLKDGDFRHFTTRTELQATTVPLVVNGGPAWVRTSGYSAVGDGGGALYKRVNSQPGHTIWIQSADGAFWEWTDEGNGLSVMASGAVADAGYSFPNVGINTVFTGTDNWAAIQNCIDAHTYYSLGGHVSFPTGKFKINKTLQCGYGTDFRTTRLIGAGRPYAPDIASGTWLFCNFSNQNGINGQGQRGFVVQDLGLYGLNAGWVINNDLGGSSVVDDTDINNWSDPALAVTSSLSVYCGISTDAYLGTAPVPAYPDVTFPAIVGTPGQYSKSSSSGMYFENVTIQGFVVGVCNQPNGGASNGDFMSLRNVTISKCVLGLSIGGDQSRNVYRERVIYTQCYTAETSYYQGIGHGKMGGVSIDCSAGQCINLCEYDLTYSGIIKYVGLYTEAMWRIGVLQSASGNAGNCEFDTCTFGFSLQTPARGIPTDVVNGAALPCLIKFSNCLFASFKSVLPFSVQSWALSFENCFMNNRQAVTRTGQYQFLANNALLGGLVLLTEGINIANRIRNWRCWFYTISTGVGFNDIVGPFQVGYTRDFCLSSYILQSASAATTTPPITIPLRATPDISVFTLASRTNLEVTYTIDAGWAGLANTLWHGPLPGDVIITQDGTVLFVHSWVSGTRTGIAQMQNNYKTTGGVSTPITPILMASCQIINSRVYTTDFSLQGDVTSASAVVSNAGSASVLGVGGEIANADAYFFDPDVEGTFAANDTVISAVAANSFNIGSAGATYTQARKRLPFFARVGPANS